MIFVTILFLALLLMIIIPVIIQALIYWGIGAFVCWVFAIPFTFTFSHGLAIALIISVIYSILKWKVEVNVNYD